MCPTEKDVIKKLEKTIGVPDNFFWSLLERESDWSFIVKLHSFLEAACNQMITSALSKTEIEDIVSRLDMSNKSVGKIAFIKNLSLLEEGARGFLRKLSEIRNLCVHNIENISLSLKEYVQKLDRQQLDNFINQIGYDTKEEIEIRGVKVKKEEFIKDNPRISIFLNANSVLLEIGAQLAHEELKIKKQEIDKAYIQFAEKMLIIAKK